MLQQPLARLWWLPVCLALLGCSDGEQRIIVTGKVTFDGQPIDNGIVLFIPEDETDSQKRPKVGTQIVDGKYAFEPDRGPMPGKYKVAITWEKKTGRKIPTGDVVDRDETEQVLPKKYNDETTIRVTVSRRDNKHDFALTSN